MSDFILSCCSTSDLDEQHYKDRDIRYVCFHYFLGDKEYPDDFGKSVPFKEFYARMAEGVMTRTSQVNEEEYTEYFESFLKAGKDVLHVTLSSGISGSYNSACLARDALAAKYPERKLYVVDSRGASSGYGLLMDKLADVRDEGKTIDEVRDYAEAHRLEVHHWFFSTDLKYYVRGGRISKASGFIGSLLRICPLLNMDAPGHLVPREKVITKKRVIRRIVEKMEQCAAGGLDYADKVYISNSDCIEDARAVADLVEARFPKMKGKVEIYEIGTTIGSHTGPGTVALFFWGEPRK